MVPKEIRRYKGIEEGLNEYGHFVYYIPCEKCGIKIQKRQYSLKRSYVCDMCKAYDKKREKAIAKSLDNDIRTEHEKRFDKAIDVIKAKDDISKYSKAVEIAKTKCELYGSVPEAVMAILLIYNGIRIIPQQKILRYKVDFTLPDLKRIIEVDGEIYHNNKAKELEREAAINYAIGLDWRIIRIPSQKIYDISKINKFICEGIRGQ